MNNTKRYLALLMAGTMAAVPFTVNAASQELTGDGVVESDQSKAPAYAHVVLPTMSADAYDFTLDPTELLSQYDTVKYGTSKTIYFLSEKDAATLTPTTSGDILFILKKDNGATTVATLEGKVTLDASGNVASISGNYYLWVPDSDSTEGAGKYLLLDKDNFATYFKFEADGTDTTKIKSSTLGFLNAKSGASVCDGKIYTDKYDEFAAATDVLSDYIELETDGTVKTVTNLYVGANDDNVTALTAATINDESAAIYKAAVAAYQDKSDKVTIVNKSTYDATVTAKVELKNFEGLTISANGTYTGDTNASVYFAITDGTTPVVLAEVTDSADPSKVTGVSAEKTFPLAKGASTPNHYMGEGTDPVTGGHIYKQYEAADVTYEDASFYITASANGEAGAEDAWATYVQGLTAETRPSLKVVYSITLDGAETELDASALKWSGTTAWITVATSDLNITKVEYSTDGGTTFKTLTNYTTPFSSGKQYVTFDGSGVVKKGSTVIRITADEGVYVLNY